jgi:hypothetical protein
MFAAIAQPVFAASTNSGDLSRIERISLLSAFNRSDRMADTEEKAEQQQANETILVARVRVHLQSGESFGLLPFEDMNDVKGKVSDLIGDWSRSGFLIFGGFVYPWHEVKLIEAIEVAELSKSALRQRLEEWNAPALANLQQSFWKTKRAREKKSYGDVKEESH